MFQYTFLGVGSPFLVSVDIKWCDTTAPEITSGLGHFLADESAHPELCQS
jgi:hypothetical protein